MKPRVLFLIFSASMFCGISGCDDSGVLTNWIENTSKLKTEALRQSEVTPYRAEQYQALKGYFMNLESMALTLKTDSNYRKKFNDAATRADLGQVCGKALIERAHWEKIVQNCTRNRFFVCSEEVRAYPDFVRSIHESLSKELQKRFDAAAACQVAL